MDVLLHFAVRLLYFSEIFATLLLSETPELPPAFLSVHKSQVEKVSTKNITSAFSARNTQLHYIQNAAYLDEGV